MYCSKCGAQNELNSKFCIQCGNSLNQVVDQEDKKVKSIKTISVIAFIFSIILPPVGLVLSIIGLVKCNKYKKETNKNVSYLPFNIVGIIVSIFISFIIILIILVFASVFSIFNSNDKILKSTWNCRTNSYFGNYVLTVQFNEKDFLWAKYGDEEENQLRGNYYILSREYDDGTSEYEIKFTPNYYISNGIESDDYPKSMIMDIDFDQTSATITSENSFKYYCERK